MSTYTLARRLGAGTVLTDGQDRFQISDYSPSTGQVYGWRLRSDNRRGAYVELPADLMEFR